MNLQPQALIWIGFQRMYNFGTSDIYETPALPAERVLPHPSPHQKRDRIRYKFD
jgi:hypothetical protein